MKCMNIPSSKCALFWLFSIQLLKKHTLNPEITLFYQLHAQKALFKVTKICTVNFWRQLWESFKTTMGQLCDKFKKTLIQLWDEFETTLWQLWDNIGTTFGQFWDNFNFFGSTLRQLGELFGTTLRHLWVLSACWRSIPLPSGQNWPLTPSRTPKLV